MSPSDRKPIFQRTSRMQSCKKLIFSWHLHCTCHLHLRTNCSARCSSCYQVAVTHILQPHIQQLYCQIRLFKFFCQNYFLVKEHFLVIKHATAESSPFSFYCCYSSLIDWKISIDLSCKKASKMVFLKNGIISQTSQWLASDWTASSRTSCFSFQCMEFSSLIVVSPQLVWEVFIC